MNSYNFEKQKIKPKKKPWKIVIVLVAVVIAVLIGIACFNMGNDEEENDLNAYINAEKYYEENSDIISTIDADKSENVQTESEASDLCQERGFSMYPITYECTIDGEYQPAEEVSESSEEKHPVYQTYYVSSTGDVWTINMIAGRITANPVTYNQDNTDVQKVVSENESVIGYDISTNRFFETKPYDSALEVIVVDRIDTDTLDKIKL